VGPRGRERKKMERTGLKNPVRGIPFGRGTREKVLISPIMSFEDASAKPKREKGKY